jgi:hypothetical protein
VRSSRVNRRLIGWITAALCGLAVGAAVGDSKNQPAVYENVDQARSAVRLMADFYREHLLLVHQTYVRDNKPPAATVIREQFVDMTALGWPKAHWLSVNGNPLNPANRPQDDFEREAARAIRRGEDLVERIEAATGGGKRYRAVASVAFTGPCLKCHWGEKESDYFGAITFVVPLASIKATRPTK